MRHQKILNLLNEVSNSKFLTEKLNILNDHSNAHYDARNEIIYNPEVLKSTLCDQNDVHVLLIGDITITGDNRAEVAFRNCASFIRCIAKIDATTIDDAEDLDLVMPIYNLSEYSSNCSDTNEVYGFIQNIKKLFLMLIMWIMFF